MPPKPLVDLGSVDLDRVAYDAQALDTYLPQTDLMRQLHGVHSLDTEAGVAVGYRDVRDDEFWCAGHFSGHPIFPGVLLVETVAQLCVFYWRYTIGREQAPGRAMLFGGIEGVKFRDAIQPGQRVTVLTRAEKVRIRRSTFDTQALVGDKIVFEGQIIGLLGPHFPEMYPDGV